MALAGTPSVAFRGAATVAETWYSPGGLVLVAGRFPCLFFGLQYPGCQKDRPEPGFPLWAQQRAPHAPFVRWGVAATAKTGDPGCLRLRLRRAWRR